MSNDPTAFENVVTSTVENFVAATVENAAATTVEKVVTTAVKDFVTTDKQYAINAGDAVWVWMVYTIEGMFMVGANLPILLICLRFSAFRKQKVYIFVMGLACGDFLQGMAFFCGGLWRSVVVLQGGQNDRMSAVECLLTVQNVIWAFSVQISSLMVLSISIDRLLSVVLTLQYLNWSRSYALAFVGVVYAYSLSYGAVGISNAFAQSDERIYPKLCFWQYPYGKEWVKLNVSVATASSFFSVMVYLIVLLVGRRYYQQALRDIGDQADVDYKLAIDEQRRMTVSLAISSGFTFALYVIPLASTNLFVPYIHIAGIQLVVNLLWITTNFNPMLNIVIYIVRHWQVRKAMKALFACRDLPDNMDLWTE